MARYNRDFLIPYLENLCALHMVQNRLEDKRERAIEQNDRIISRQNGIEPPKMQAKSGIAFPIFSTVAGAAIILLAKIQEYFEVSDILGAFFTIGGWFMVIAGSILLIYNLIKNKGIQMIYDEEYEEYRKEYEKRRKAAIKSDRKLSGELELLDKQLNDVEYALKKVYAANIIPRRYRDLYAIAYLYDWFSTSDADDMDMALNTYVLEEIKDRLDIIIEQNERNLINQKMIIANQYKTLAQQEKYHKEMTEKLNQLNVTAEEQTRYLSMIEGNTAAMAYFSAAEYIRKL